MARKPSGENPRLPPPTKSDREKIIEAFMALLAERPFEEIGFGDIAARSGLTLAQCRGEFSSTVAVLAAQIKELDCKVLAGGEADMAEEPPRERLFDVLMRRLETLAPHRAAVRSLVRSSALNPGLARTLAALDRELARGQRWANLLDDVGRFVPRCSRRRRRTRRRYDGNGAGEEPV